MIFFMVVVPMVVTPQRLIVLVRIFPFKIEVVPDEGEQLVIGDVEGGGGGGVNWRGSLFFSNCSWGRF